jgi:hypothetical protein
LPSRSLRSRNVALSPRVSMHANSWSDWRGALAAVARGVSSSAMPTPNQSGFLDVLVRTAPRIDGSRAAPAAGKIYREQQEWMK